MLANADKLEKAHDTLVRFGHEAIEPLIRAFATADDDHSPGILEVLIELGAPAMRALYEAAQASTGTQRGRFIRTLGAFDKDAAKSCAWLVGQLDDPEPTVRSSAAAVLAGLGAKSADALSKLIRLCDDAVSIVRVEACLAVGSLDKNVDRLLRILDRLARDREVEVRRAALCSLKNLAKSGRPALAAVRSCLRDDALRRDAIEAIAAIGHADSALLDDLQPLLSDRTVDLLAAKTIWELFRRADLVMPAVIRGLKPYDKKGSPEAASDLVHEIGPAAAEAAPALSALLLTHDYDTLWAATDALAAIGPPAAAAIVNLIDLLHHPSGRVGSSAAHALARIGEVSLQPLLTALETGDNTTREFAADALGQFGPRAKSAVRVLARIGSDESIEGGDLKAWIALAVAEITLDPGLAPTLLFMIRAEANEMLVERAGATLKVMGISEKQALAALRQQVNEAKKARDPSAKQMAKMLKVLEAE